MTEKIDIAEILKDKPANTKLYSPLFGEVYFSHVGGGNIAVEHHGGISLFFSSGRFFDYDESEPLLFPSKEMRDWSKFAWKKGDVLVSKHGTKEVIFDGFDDDYYVTFKGKHALETIEGISEYKGESDDGYDWYRLPTKRAYLYITKDITTLGEFLVCVGLDRHNLASINFVHQLQHLLFGLGINSEIEV